MTKAIRLVAIHSFLCIDHELDLSVNEGIDCLAYRSLFEKASCIVSTVRASSNLYRRLRDQQVEYVGLFSLLYRCLCAVFLLAQFVDLGICPYGDAAAVHQNSMAK